MTRTVVLVILSFLFFNLPSGIFRIVDLLVAKDSREKATVLAEVAEVTNALVTCGKTINFFLYCASSANFRKKLCSLIGRRATSDRARLRRFASSTRTIETSFSQLGISSSATPDPGTVSVRTSTRKKQSHGGRRIGQPVTFSDDVANTTSASIDINLVLLKPASA